MAVSFGLGLGVTLVPEATQNLPSFLKQVVATPITLAGLSAIILSLVIPEEQTARQADGALADATAHADEVAPV